MSIAATITPADLKNQRWDVVVIGAGPSGSIAARELALRRLSVLLVDHARFPRPKVCGCCLNRSALTTLADAGLADLVSSYHAMPLTRLQLGAAATHAHVSIDGMALSRDAFDGALVEAAIQAGVSFLPECHALIAPVADAQHRSVTLRHAGTQSSVQSRVVIGASGLGGRLFAEETKKHSIIESKSRLGAGVIVDDYPAFYRSRTIYMAVGHGGYAGLVHLEDGRLNVAAAFDGNYARQAGGHGRTAAGILREAGFPEIAGLEQMKWHGTPWLTRHARRPAEYRTFLLGDAASFVEPFTGEGMAWALASGLAVVPFVLRACQEWKPTLATQWAACYRKWILRRQYLCRAAATVLRHPGLVWFVIGTLNYFPFLAAPFVQYINHASKVTANFASS